MWLHQVKTLSRLGNGTVQVKNQSRRLAVSQATVTSRRFMKNTTSKLQASSSGGARITVERFNIIFLLPLEAPRDIHVHVHALNY